MIGVTGIASSGAPRAALVRLGMIVPRPGALGAGNLLDSIQPRY
jgi:hypothetical protein